MSRLQSGGSDLSPSPRSRRKTVAPGATGGHGWVYIRAREAGDRTNRLVVGHGELSSAARFAGWRLEPSNPPVAPGATVFRRLRRLKSYKGD